MAVHLAVSGDVFDGVIFVLPFIQQDGLNEIMGLNEPVSEDFSYLLLQLRYKRRFFSHVYNYLKHAVHTKTIASSSNQSTCILSANTC